MVPLINDTKLAEMATSKGILYKWSLVVGVTTPTYLESQGYLGLRTGLQVMLAKCLMVQFYPKKRKSERKAIP